MLTYFTQKLKGIKNDIKRNTSYVIQYANEGDIKKIQDSTKQLQKHNERYSEYSKDASKYLPINELITLLREELIDVRDASYIMQYDRYITVSERDALSSISYQFKSARIK